MIFKKNILIFLNPNMSTLTKQPQIPSSEEKNTSEEKSTYIQKGYLKIDGLRSMTETQLKNVIEKFAKTMQKIDPVKYAKIRDFILDINIVPPSTKGESYGLAYVLIKENNPGNILYELLIDDTNTIKISSIRMNVADSKRELDRLENSFQKNPENQTPLANKELLENQRSYEDYVFYMDIYNNINNKNGIDENNILSILEKLKENTEKRLDADEQKLDEEEFESNLEKYSPIINICGSILDGQSEEFDELLLLLKKNSEKISMCDLKIQASYVTELKPDQSTYHLISTDLSTSPFKIKAELIKSYFTIFNTVTESVSARYKGPKDDENDYIEIEGSYPHVWLQEVVSGNKIKIFAHVVFSDSLLNYDARYAIQFRTKLQIGTGADSFFIVFHYYNPKMDPSLKVESSRTRERYSGYIDRPTIKIPSVVIGKNRPFTNKTNEESPVLTSISSPNKFNLLPGKTKSNPESVWTNTLPAHIKMGNENTLPGFNNVSNIIIPDGPRKYDPSRRDDGNLSRFF